MVAGLLKVRRGMSEIISTLMLNYIAILFVQYMTRGPLQDPKGYLPESAQFVAAARMPTFFDTRLHLGVLSRFSCADCLRAAVVDAAGLPATGRRLTRQRRALRPASM